MRRNTAMQNVIDRYFESLGVTPRIAMEVENNEAIKSLVRVGLGRFHHAAVRSVMQEPPDGVLRVLRDQRQAPDAGTEPGIGRRRDSA
jgi:hypothetical protein